jgi:hypothetical protein
MTIMFSKLVYVYLRGCQSLSFVKDTEPSERDSVKVPDAVIVPETVTVDFAFVQKCIGSG